METIYHVDLTHRQIRKEAYDIRSEKDYGRGLGLQLLRAYTPQRAGRTDPENALVLVPGLFAGCVAPSSGRMTVLAKGGADHITACNTTGDMPQKLGSLQICALVITGKDPEGNAVVHIDANGARIVSMPKTQGAYTPQIIRLIKERFGPDSAILGTGIAGDHGLSLSTVFCTYPKGEPAFNCPRNGFGDIPASKGLRAVVVSGSAYFARHCENPALFRSAGKNLAAEILENEFCGKTLPTQGSVSLIHLLKQSSPIENDTPTDRPPAAADQTINYTCSPLCVIGCLNRHRTHTGEHYDAPDQSELKNALKDCFGIDDAAFLRKLQDRIRALCLVSPEFVTAANSYFVATGQEPSKAALFALLDEIELNSTIGQLLGTRAEGIARAYPHKPELAKLNDRPALADEHLFPVKIRKTAYFSDTDDLTLLYYRIYLLENLGICLFAAFAIINNPRALDLLAQMFTDKTGVTSNANDLTRYAARCIEQELQFETDNGNKDPVLRIPPFTKMLYRYFAQ